METDLEVLIPCHTFWLLGLVTEGYTQGYTIMWCWGGVKPRTLHILSQLSNNWDTSQCLWLSGEEIPPSSFFSITDIPFDVNIKWLIWSWNWLIHFFIWLVWFRGRGGLVSLFGLFGFLFLFLVGWVFFLLLLFGWLFYCFCFETVFLSVAMAVLEPTL